MLYYITVKNFNNIYSILYHIPFPVSQMVLKIVMINYELKIKLLMSLISIFKYNVHVFQIVIIGNQQGVSGNAK